MILVGARQKSSPLSFSHSNMHSGKATEYWGLRSVSVTRARLPGEKVMFPVWKTVLLTFCWLPRAVAGHRQAARLSSFIASSGRLCATQRAAIPSSVQRAWEADIFVLLLAMIIDFVSCQRNKTEILRHPHQEKWSAHVMQTVVDNPV